MKTLTFALISMVVAFFAAVTLVHAQTATPTTSPTMTPTATVTPTPTGSSSLPSGAPNTGFGF